MRRVAAFLVPAAAAAFAAAAFAAAALAQESTPADGPGWTGATNAADVIAARRALMNESERLMKPIDGYAAGEAGNPAELKSAAESIAAMMLAVPHLFPPTTDRFDPEAEAPQTLALPEIWDDFESFYRLASAASDAARSMTSAEGAEDLRGGSRGLRAACDACHARFLRPYSPPEVSSEDVEFDFDSVFPSN